MRPLVTLTTDFGEGACVAQMKGVILGLCREAMLVDLTHDLPRHDAAAAAWLLRDVVASFPAGTIHLVVVDPGVGTSRRGLALRTEPSTARGQCFVGPDNGTFTDLVDGAAVHELGERAPRRSPVSPVFHGRDLFAPVVAHLARGGTIESLGPVVRDPVRLELPRARLSGNEIAGVALFADRFGNIATNVEATELAALGAAGFAVEIAGQRIDRAVRTYAEAPAGELIALVGSSGRLEIAVREGSAAKRLGLPRPNGAPVRVIGK